MEYKHLKNIAQITMGQSPKSETYNNKKEGLPFFQGNADFGEISPKVRIWCSVPKKVAHKNDILISVRAPIGALNIADTECCIGRGLAAISVRNIKDRDYIFNALKAKSEYLKNRGTGSTFKAINKNILEDVEIPIVSTEKRDIEIKVLNKLNIVKKQKEKELSKLDTLIKARFVEMFGDPVKNEKKFLTKQLSQIGKCKNGINFHKSEIGNTVNCLTVKDFENNQVINDTTRLAKIKLSNLPSNDYFLNNGDIVFVRSNGNKSLVGRSVLIFPNNNPTLFSGFCIRFRKDSKRLESVYLLWLLKNESIRMKMRGRGVNIQNLNQQIINNLSIPVPPIELQKEFASFVQQVDKSKVVNNLIMKYIISIDFICSLI